MGQVWLADDLTLDRRVAIKTIAGPQAGDGGARSRFLREARVMATVEHPHVVRVYAYGDAGPLAYFVMEYVDGGTLGALLRRASRLEPAESLRITRQVTLALAAAWQRKVVHRDVKPGNVLLDAEGGVRVGDFGLARPVMPSGDASLTLPGALVGSPHYMSPEQARGRDVDFRSDIYSLGVVLFEMLAGGRPFEGASPAEVIAHQLHDPLPPLIQKCPDLPTPILGLVEDMTAKDPAKRPQSYRQLLQRIEESSPEKGRGPSLTSAPTFTEWRTARGGTGRRRLLRALAALGVAAAGAGTWWGVASRNPDPGSSRGLAIAAFYGPDELSAREGRLLAALLEAEISRRRGDGLRVIGADDVGSPIRTESAARSRAGKLGVEAVVWGQVLTMGAEVEAQPWLTSATRSQPLATIAIEAADGQGALERRRAAATSLADAVLAGTASATASGRDPPAPR
jgi:hypothetical protein